MIILRPQLIDDEIETNYFFTETLSYLHFFQTPKDFSQWLLNDKVPQKSRCYFFVKNILCKGTSCYVDRLLKKHK